MQGTHTFQLGSLDALGRVHLSPAGRDLVRAIIMRGMATAKRGLAKAEAMKRAGAGDLTKGSIDYYRHAAAFLAHMLTSMGKYSIELREELHALRGIPEGEDYPTEWTPFLILASELTVPNEPDISPDVGHRTNSKRKPGKHPAKGHSSGGGGAGKADG